MNNRIIALQETIARCNKEIEDIRAACPHTDTVPGIYNSMRYCRDCGDMLSLTSMPANALRDIIEKAQIALAEIEPLIHP